MVMQQFIILRDGFQQHHSLKLYEKRLSPSLKRHLCGHDILRYVDWRGFKILQFCLEGTLPPVHCNGEQL